MFGMDVDAISKPFLEKLEEIAVKLDKVIEVLEDIRSNTSN